MMLVTALANDDASAVMGIALGVALHWGLHVLSARGCRMVTLVVGKGDTPAFSAERVPAGF